MEAGSLQHFLGLFHSDRVGALLLSRLLVKFGSFAALSQSGAGKLETLGLKKVQIAAIVDGGCDRDSVAKVEQVMAWSEAGDRHLLHYDGPGYPALLKEIHTPPPLLFVKGRCEVVNDIGLAIVGSRKCSDYGRHTSFWMASELGRQGLTICSGLARGIDTAAHRGALEGGAETIAVLGTGIDVCYPKANAPLARKISEQGALVSEFPLGSQPRRHQFPQRNRIISGLCVGTLVVEANARSGSLITARLALEQNREVYSIPGPVFSPGSRGCHRLIRQGAELVESPQDILASLAELGLVIGRLRHPSPATTVAPGEPVTGRLRKILTAVSHSGSIPDSLVSQTRLPWPDINAALLELELMGRIYKRDGRYFPQTDGLHGPLD